MGSTQIELDFGGFALDAELFDTPVAKAFAEHLPYEVNLTQWGRELYGGTGKDLGSHDPVGTIPPGGIAYTDQGGLVCIFFGQTPAWAVDHIGQIREDQWRQLLADLPLDRVVIRRKGPSAG